MIHLKYLAGILRIDFFLQGWVGDDGKALLEIGIGRLAVVPTDCGCNELCELFCGHVIADSTAKKEGEEDEDDDPDHGFSRASSGDGGGGRGGWGGWGEEERVVLQRYKAGLEKRKGMIW